MGALLAGNLFFAAARQLSQSTEVGVRTCVPLCAGTCTDMHSALLPVLEALMSSRHRPVCFQNGVHVRCKSVDNSRYLLQEALSRLRAPIA